MRYSAVNPTNGSGTKETLSLKISKSKSNFKSK